MPKTTLPYLPESSSEALSSTHLFSVEVVSAEASPWTKGSDGLEHRSVDMAVRLLENFKGELAIARGATFMVRVEQRRESEYSVSDYYGLWSHLNPQPGVRLLIVANGETDSPAALMQEGACERILDAKYESDVRADLEAEQVFRQSLRESTEADPESAAVESLVEFAFDRRATSRDVMARYVWDYVEPVFLREPDRILPALLALITAEDANIELRRSLIADLYDAVLRLEGHPEAYWRTVAAFFSLLWQASASPLHHYLIAVPLYNLIFREDEPVVAARDLFPNAADRTFLKGVISAFDSDRAHALIEWLDR